GTHKQHLTQTKVTKRTLSTKIEKGALDASQADDTLERVGICDGALCHRHRRTKSADDCSDAFRYHGTYPVRHYGTDAVRHHHADTAYNTDDDIAGSLSYRFGTI